MRWQQIAFVRRGCDPLLMRRPAWLSQAKRSARRGRKVQVSYSFHDFKVDLSTCSLVSCGPLIHVLLACCVFGGPSLRQRPHQQKSSSVWRGSGLALFIYVYTPIHTHACVHTYMLLRVESTARRHNFATPSRHAFAQAFVWGLDYEPAYLACTLLPFPEQGEARSAEFGSSVSHMSAV